MIRIKYADSYFKRLLGLMFKKDIDYGLLFILKYGSSIHTCFMRFTIDAYFLDENKVIIDKTTLKPWKFYSPSKKAKYILETKENFLNLKKGEKIEFR
ncbi:MAG: DUF192 domain-containing protein [Methanobrevibacter sp.]|uniref:DUF192 domain-containing protein n=1 Tax=Methanobrevibacter sp. TaxID=66852 RepID=UPI0025D4F29E|nr:DUF192 domain-containing protein [Methanobrevibacter sp.]MBR0270940.1 DUF192 domain-containing protein [Methanobrevibacter sp.]